MEHGGRFSGTSSSDSESADIVERLIRNVRRDRFVYRSLAWSIYEEASLNLRALFGEEEELPAPPHFDVDERYAVRYNRRRSRFEGFAGRGDYGIDTLFADPAPVVETLPTQLPRDNFEDWAAGLEAAVANAYTAGSDNDGERDLFGAAIAQAAAGAEADWGQFGTPRVYVDEPRTSLGHCLVEARTDVRRSLIVAVIQIRQASPDINVRTAWLQLVDRLRHERVIVRESEAERMWAFAFNESAALHFRYILEADYAEIDELWNHL